MYLNSKNLKAMVVVLAAIFLSVASCTPNIEVVEVGGGTSPLIPPQQDADGADSNDDSLSHNSSLYGVWYFEGNIEKNNTGNPFVDDATSTEKAVWMLSLEKNNTWRIAYWEYSYYYDYDEGNYDLPSGMENTKGFNRYKFFAAGSRFEFNGTNQIIFTIDSTFEVDQLIPAARGTATIKINAPNKCEFIPTFASAVAFQRSGRLDVAFTGEWERK